jgi:hypothetical protein
VLLLHVFCSCGGDGVFLHAFRIVWNMSGKTCWGRCELLRVQQRRRGRLLLLGLLVLLAGVVLGLTGSAGLDVNDLLRVDLVFAVVQLVLEFSCGDMLRFAWW